MGDFPDKVSTNTTSSFQATQLSTQIVLDKGFVKTIPGILMILEIVFGLLVWALIAATSYTSVPPLGWVLFVAVFFWLLTIFFFTVDLFALYTRAQNINWSLVSFGYNLAAAVIYLTAAITDAASSNMSGGNDRSHLVASTFFAFMVTLLHGASCACAFRAWRGGSAPHAPSSLGGEQTAVHATNVAIVQIQAVEFRKEGVDAQLPSEPEVNIYRQ